MRWMFDFFEEVMKMCEKCNLNPGIVVGQIIENAKFM